MKIGILLTLVTVLMTGVPAQAQYQQSTTVGPLNVGDKFYIHLDGYCAITGTSTNSKPDVATISPATFTNFPVSTIPDAANAFTITALSPGSNVIVVNFTETTCPQGLQAGGTVKSLS